MRGKAAFPMLASPETGPRRRRRARRGRGLNPPWRPAGTRAARKDSTMKLPLAGLASLAALGAHAQAPGTVTPLPPLLVTASRSAEPVPTLRDAIVITREELDAAGPLSLGEVLERRTGIELRSTGGPGQPQGLFLRGTGTAQTLVLVDGLRVGSATVGTTSIENIPLDLIERIEVVKGPLSSV